MRRLASVLMLGAVLLGACSSSDLNDSKAASDPAAESSRSGANDSEAFCDGFTALAQQREDQGAGAVQRGSNEAVPDGKDGWDRRIETTQNLAASAPADYQDEANTYVELVKARAGLFETYDYPETLAEIPADATQAFISDHIDEQQQVNRLIAFAKEECNVA